MRRAHRLVRGGTRYVLLRSATYGRRYVALGRYLALALEDAPPSQGARRGCRAAQARRVYDAPGQDDVLLEAIEAEDGSGHVTMRHRAWRNSGNPSALMTWVVEAIPPRQDPQELPQHVIPVSLPSPLHQTPRVDLAEQGSCNLSGLKFS